VSPTDDYLSLILYHSNLSPDSILTVFFLGLMRMGPIVAIVPFLGSKLPGGVKMGLLISVTAIALPQIFSTLTLPAPIFDEAFSFLALKELFIGMVIAILASLPFYVAQSSGVLIDFLRGSSALMVTDPVIQAQTSPIGLLYNYVFIVFFYQLGGPFIFLDAIFRSYTVIAANQWIPSTFFMAGSPVWQSIFGLLTQFTSLAIQFAAPSLVAILMAEMFLGIANRLAPQVQIAFLGMALKSLLGIAILWAGWFFILQQIGTYSLSWMHAIDRLVFSLR
jgi:type III secretion protein T